MKLRNKDDGRVREFGIDETKSFPYYLRDELGNTYWAKTLKEIADKWEEIEEPKKYWYIDIDGEINYGVTDNSIIKEMKEIGNYFSSREEAELVVRKLKAWKRLKDNWFKFELWDYDGGNLQERIRTGKILFRVKDKSEVVEDDLDLLFGGEE